MANIHSPHRQPGETQKEYRERMQKSRGVAFYVRKVALHELGNKEPSTRDRHRARVAAERAAVPAAKFQKQRTRKQHKHLLHDQHGAYTCVGPVYEVYGMNPDEGREHVIGAGQESDGTVFYSARRKWLAGISEQRGY